MTLRFFLLLLIPIIFSFSSSWSQIIARIAGDGTGVPGYSGNGQLARHAVLHYPAGIARDKKGNLYLADYLNSVIRKIDKQGFITVYAGTGEQGYSGDGGSALAAKLTYPSYLFFDRAGNLLFSDFQVIRKVDTNGIISTIAGSGDIGFAGDNGPATAAWFKNPSGITQDKSGNIYIADSYNDRIRKIDGAGTITTYAGSYPDYTGDGGPATAAHFRKPSDITFDKHGNMYVADRDNHVIRKIDTNGVVTTVVGDGRAAGTNTGPGWGGDGMQAIYASISMPISIKVDDSGALYFCEARNNIVRKVDARGITHTIAGTTYEGICKDGTPARQASLSLPFGLWVESSSEIYFTDRNNHMILKILNETPPKFVKGNSTAIDICSDSARYNLGDILAVYDTDKLQGLTWSIATPPLHGGIVGTYESVAGDTAIPESIYYIPYRSHSGSDSFTIKVSDGYFADSIVVSVMVMQEGELTCGPVPSKGEIQLSGVFGCNTQAFSLIVFNAVGQRVFYKDIIAPGGILNERMVLDRSLSQGMYFLKVVGSNQARLFRLQLE